MRTEKKPLVTVVMPCFNAEKYIMRALRSLIDEWSIKSCEFLVVDGGSTDGTRAAVEELRNPTVPPFNKGGEANPPCLPLTKRGAGGNFQDDDMLWFASSRGTWVREPREGQPGDWNPPVGGRRRPVIRIVDNPFRSAARGLNIGILEARGTYIARADAGATYSAGYLRRCIELLEQKEAANAGGIEIPMAEGGHLGEAIVLAFGHPLGGGSVKLRHAGYAASAETGTYRRKLFDELGMFDPKSRTDEAAEMNVRIVLAGQKIWIDESVKVFRFVPTTFGELAKRFFRAGGERARTAKKHWMLMSWRQIASPLLVVMMAFSLARSFKAPSHLLFFAAYAACVLAAALAGPRPKDAGPDGPGTRFLAGAALMTMHVTWGAGFFWGLLAKW
jgi:succinoglycan biosynthesis protein ExoA